MREQIDMAVFGLFPDYVRVSIWCAGIEPDSRAAHVQALLRSAAGGAGTRGASQASVLAWREAYAALGFPDDIVAPHQALAAWAATPGGVPSHGPVIDLVNAFSLAHGLPTAAYDLAQVTSPLRLQPSRGIETHGVAGGGTQIPSIGELILVDAADQVLARHWHGAPGASAMPSAQTTDALIHLDILAPGLTVLSPEALATRFEHLAEGLLGGKAEPRLLDRGRPRADWPQPDRAP